MSELQTVIGVSGRSGTGKTSLALGLASRFSVPHAAFSDVLRSDAELLGAEPTTQILQELGEKRISQGWPAFVDAVLGAIGWPPPRSAVIEGIRHVEAVDILRLRSTPLRFTLVYLDAEVDERDRRLRERNRDNLDSAAIDAHPVESEVSELRATSDLVLAAGTIEEWIAAVEDEIS